MELGPIQKEWIKSLREHPERQMSGHLGAKSEDGKNYKACCLGEGLCMLRRLEGKDPLNFFEPGGRLLDNVEHNYLIPETADKLGLHDGKGQLKGEVAYIQARGHRLYSLSSANDTGMTWPEIADFIEKYPDSVFTKSV